MITKHEKLGFIANCFHSQALVQLYILLYEKAGLMHIGASR